ncbi:MAG: hypothetical protein WA517_09120 [Candidatus Acidiferrum sp.]
MEEGKLQLGNEAVAVQYELRVTNVRNKRQLTGTLVLGPNLGPGLTHAITKMTAANLVTHDGQVLWVEFTSNQNGHTIEFAAIPPKGFIIN